MGDEEIIEPENRRMIRSHLNDSYYEEVDLEFDGSTGAYEEKKRYRKTFKS